MTERIRLGVGAGAVALLALVLWWLAASDPVPDQLADTRAALAAWADFASTGDLGAVEGFFVVDGPQYRQFVLETTQSFDGQEYAFTLDDAEVIRPDLVGGMVTVTRDGLVTMTSRWEAELRLVDGRWQIWTVRTVASFPAS